MEFEYLLLEMNEIMHKLISKYKEKVIGENEFSDITTSHLFYIEAIYRLNNPTITELSEHLKVSKASTTTAIQKLSQKGMVKKTQSGMDKRIFNVSLSDKGKCLIESEMKAINDVTGNIKALLTEQEIEQTTSVLNKIISCYKK